MTPTPTEQKILNIINNGGACISAKAISLELGWSIKDEGNNVRKYLKRMQEKGLIQIIPQQIVPIFSEETTV